MFERSKEYREVVGKRLRITRQALNLTTTKMCRLMGSNSRGSAWTNYEQGHRLIEPEYAIVLCQNSGLTLDWIYRGLAHSGLREDLHGKIIQLRAAK
jgi:transcriptional regulator with XRE-family HTH domain